MKIIKTATTGNHSESIPSLQGPFVVTLFLKSADKGYYGDYHVPLLASKEAVTQRIRAQIAAGPLLGRPAACGGWGDCPYAALAGKRRTRSSRPSPFRSPRQTSTAGP